jgi:hypothetical protein
MTAQPRLSELPLWERHETRVLNIVRSALALLATRLPSGGEPLLNRELYFCILEANRADQRDKGRDWFDHPPVWEGRNPPTPDGAAAASESKVPDFHWSYLDHDEPDPARSARHFVIECKRLGQPTPAGWTFNTHYVEDGIRRFVDPAWRYGRDVASGAMVGYLEAMSVDAILAEVNAAATVHTLPAITLKVKHPPSVHELDHDLERSFAITPFHLTHLWLEASAA